jgi:hypothetical protein
VPVPSKVTAARLGDWPVRWTATVPPVLPKGAVDLKLSTEKVIVAAVRRIADRNFVLRHVEGLDAVFVPAASATGPLAEIEADTGPVVRKFDGRRSLKEAAAETPLDEFDTSKIACALLFLGLIERAAEPAIETTIADSGPLFSADELDSGLSIGEAPPFPAPEASAADAVGLLVSEPLPEPPTAAPQPEPALAEPPIPPPASVAPRPRAVVPAPPTVTPQPRARVPPPVTAPEPAAEPATMLLPSAPEMPATTVVGTKFSAPAMASVNASDRSARAARQLAPIAHGSTRRP